jgi:cytochrome c oxidase subunit 2
MFGILRNAARWNGFWIIAKSENEFSEWVKRQAETPPEPTSGIPAEGARLFRDRSCADCHATSAISANLGKGPPLAHLSSRRRLGGRLDNTPENLARWIANPQSTKPGNRMPDQHLSAGDLRSLVGYLENFEQTALGKKPKASLGSQAS